MEEIIRASVIVSIGVYGIPLAIIGVIWIIVKMSELLSYIINIYRASLRYRDIRRNMKRL